MNKTANMALVTSGLGQVANAGIWNAIIAIALLWLGSGTNFRSSLIAASSLGYSP